MLWLGCAVIGSMLRFVCCLPELRRSAVCWLSAVNRPIPCSMHPGPRRAIVFLLALAAWVLATLVALVPDTATAALQFPNRTRATLKNGLVVVVLPAPRLPRVECRLLIRAGSVNDPAGNEGLAHLTADVLTQGAAQRDARQIAEDIAVVGGSLEVNAGPEQVVVTCEVPRKDLAVGLELLHDVSVRPTFPAEAFTHKKDEVLGSIASEKGDPEAVANRALGPFLLGTSPLAHPANGWEKSVAAIEREDAVAFHERHFRPNNAVLAVVGDVQPKAVLAALERAFADWKANGPRPPNAYTPVPQAPGRSVLIIDKPEVTQTQIRLACMGVPRNHPDFFPITVANTILGSAFTTRLTSEPRVVQDLPDGISSWFGMFRNAGTFGVSTFTSNESIRKTIDETLNVVKGLLDNGPSEEALAKAKRDLIARFPLELEKPHALAKQLVDIEFYGLDPRYLETYDQRIGAVTMADCRRALKSYFCADDLRVLVVSNADVARKALEDLGPMQVREPD